MNTLYVIKCTRGRGLLQVLASTSFDLARNWGSEKRAYVFPDFASASSYAQAFYRQGEVEIHEYKAKQKSAA